MKPTPQKQNGFTLIEIVIVLAIAALIMVIVFLAVQGAQRSRRDTQRKNDANRIVALANNAAATSNGNYPGAAGGVTAANFNTQWIVPENFVDPSGGAYTITNSSQPIPAGTTNTIHYSAGAICSQGNMTTTGATPRNFAVQVGTESGTYCVNN